MSKEKMSLLTLVTAVLFSMNNLSFAEPASDISVSAPGKSYTHNLKELIEKAKENIKKVDKELAQQAAEELNMQKEAIAQEHFEKGNILYEQGKLKEAKREWQKALEITKNPGLEERIKASEKEERERQARIKRQQACLEKERKEKGTAGSRAKEPAEKDKLSNQRRQKEEQFLLEKQRKEREAVKKELKKKLKAEKKEQERKAEETGNKEKQNKVEENKEEQKPGQNFTW